MRPFEIEIHEITNQGIYIHQIQIEDLNKLLITCELINHMLELNDDYIINHIYNDLSRINRKFILATSQQKELLLNSPKVIKHKSPTEFFEAIQYDPANPNIAKTLKAL
jgi:hypothetical protein